MNYGQTPKKIKHCTKQTLIVSNILTILSNILELESMILLIVNSLYKSYYFQGLVISIGVITLPFIPIY